MHLQGYSSVQEVATISIEDLEDTGFYRLGHQKRLTLGIRKLKELSRSGQSSNCPPRPQHPQDYYHHPGAPQYIAQNQEIPVQHTAPLAVKPGTFSSFSSPFPGRKTMMNVQVEQHHYAGGGPAQQHGGPVQQHHQDQHQQFNRSVLVRG